MHFDMQIMAKYFIGVSASTALIAGSYGCRQVIGWEEATYWGDGGSGGMEASSSSSGGGMGMAGAGGIAGMGGVGGAGGAAGAGGSMSGCQTDMDCPSFPNSMPKCDNGKCGFTCNAGFGNCTVGAGCETNVTNNKAHCGACNNGCAAYCEGTTCNDPVSIAGGYHHHCAVMKNGDVYCWGRNEKGELGDGTLASKSVPTKVKGLPGPAVQVDGGASASAMNYTPKTCAVLVSGDLWCWGEGNSTPAKVNGVSNLKQVSVGDTHTCAVTKTGVLYCWGGNNNGQLGDGSNGYIVNPKQIMNEVILVTAGAQHTCAIKTSGNLECWGDNGAGQLGIGNKISRDMPTLVSNIANVSRASAGGNFTCASSAGNMFCWGGNQVGQLGTGNVSEQLLPKLINLPNVEEITTSINFSGTVAMDGTLRMCGYNGNGQLGIGNTTVTYLPLLVSVDGARSIASAIASTCSIVASGQVFCWGANDYGQLGNGGNVQQLTPKMVIWP